MKKLLGMALLALAFSPFAQAQTSEALAGHPEARNDRQAESSTRTTATKKAKLGAKKVRHAKATRAAKPAAAEAK